MKWLERLKLGLKKTSSNLTSSISKIFTTRRLTEATLQELEELLITTDMGVVTAAEIISLLRTHKFDKDITPQEIQIFVAEHISKLLASCSKSLDIQHQPHVIVVCGVNGNGKTTTIGKIAHKLKLEGKSVLLAACDTFRAAADLQLTAWAEMVGCNLIKADGQNTDPASLAYRAFERARAEGIDVLLIDTAGRLQNKTNLMEELSKISRVLKKLEPTAPHDTVLVIDATTGQNALSQVQLFKEAVDLSGIIITKLDGTAKAGVLLAIAKKFPLPIYFIGVGEAMEDLDSFNPQQFCFGLFGVEV